MEDNREALKGLPSRYQPKEGATVKQWLRLSATTMMMLLAFAATPYILAAEYSSLQVLENPGTGYNVQGNTENGTRRMWMTLSDATTLMCERTISETLPWSTNLDFTPAADIASIAAGFGLDPVHPGLKICCVFTCDDGSEYTLSIPEKKCVEWLGGCQVCREECSDGWVNCPDTGANTLDLRS